MFNVQTSLAGATLALTRFVHENGLSIFWSEYPYWYLGRSLVKDLIGPVYPLVLLFLSRFGVSLEMGLAIVTILAIIAMALGWGMVAKYLGGNARLGWLVFLFSLVLPWKYVQAFGFSDPTAVLAKALVPWVIVGIVARKKVMISMALLIFSMTNLGVITMLFLALIPLAVVISDRQETIKQMNKGLVLVSLVVLVWYGPAYAINLVLNPSVGGRSGFGAVIEAVGFIRNWLPILLAVMITKFVPKTNNRFESFAVIWTALFLITTLFRFLADIDFWQDWIAWLGEIELGIGFLFAQMFLTKHRLRMWCVPLVTILVVVSMLTYILIYIKYPTNKKLYFKLSETVGNNKIFLSGSVVWWVGNYSNVFQIRGGNDRVTNSQDWNKMAWVIRESEDTLETSKALTALGIKYVLVSRSSSKELFKDFKYQEKWDTLGEVIWEIDGDALYKILSE